MKSYTYIIEGDPRPLARPRLSTHKVYDSQRNEKLILAINLRNQHQDRPFFAGPVRMDITFFMEVPKSRVRERHMLFDTSHFYKPDLSNMIKFYEDLATDILFKDDCIISEIVAKKIYGEPRTEFTITSLKG